MGSILGDFKEGSPPPNWGVRGMDAEVALGDAPGGGAAPKPASQGDTVQRGYVEAALRLDRRFS
jgi:hypothetical protein